MTEGGDQSAGFAEFAKAHGLVFTEGGTLPKRGGLLARDSLKVIASAAGKLPGDSEGTLARLTYAYKSNDSTHTAKLTAVVVAVPESIGFAPHLGDATGVRHGAGAGTGSKSDRVKLSDDVSIYAAEGIDESWLRELFSPALTDWLSRSPDGFGWELSEGILTVSRDGHLSSERELVLLCEDAARLAGALREESLEEVASGSAERSAAKAKPDPQETLVAMLAPLVELDRAPENVVAARPAAHELVVHHGSTYAVGLFMTLVWTVVVNVIGGGIFGLLLNIPNPLLAVAIFEAVVITTVGYLAIRHEINSRSEKLATELFWREYARERGLESLDPRTFAATHAEAELPGSPKRVFAGSFGGIDGALALSGNGLKRGDTIALVRGPAGPLASAPLEFSAPGASAKGLDRYVERLAAELRSRPTGRMASERP